MHIDWTNEHKLGLPAIDTDHQELATICNEFRDAATEAPIAHLATILDRMLLRARAHFVAEERMLDRHGYPRLAVHKAEHDRLLAQGDALRHRFADAAGEHELRPVALETANFLQFWLLDHIHSNDRPYRPFLMSLS